MAKFKPVQLVRGDASRTAHTAVEETNLRFEGWRSSPQGESATDAPEVSEPIAQNAPKPGGAKPAPKN